ncbi:prolipoprotein diacylglyceryl transferase [Georgenia sp. Z1344]|uniref:prolipoprotein diacylglyceryl transferase n=1 Tax=Georgenia sp. Z1344 TaxID=3416706 RepID=UPI003CF99D42
MTGAAALLADGAARAATFAAERGIPSPPDNVLNLGPLPLRAYAMAIIAGAILAWWILDRRYTFKGGPAETALDIALYWMVPFGIVGARIYHVATHPSDFFGPDGNLLDALKIWEGGLGIMGAVVFGALGAYIGLTRRGLRIGPFADALAPGMLVAQGVGRLGNYFNQELYGTATDLPWGLRIDRELPELVHPTFLYEGLWNLTGAIVVVLAQRRLRLDGGRVFWLYVIIYLTGRTLTESLRTDPSVLIGGMRIHQIIAIAGWVIGVAMIVWLTRRARAKPDRDEIWLPGRGPLADAAVAGDAGSSSSGTSVEVASDDDETSDDEPDADSPDGDAPTDEQASSGDRSV